MPLSATAVAQAKPQAHTLQALGRVAACILIVVAGGLAATGVSTIVIERQVAERCRSASYPRRHPRRRARQNATRRAGSSPNGDRPVGSAKRENAAALSVLAGGSFDARSRTSMCERLQNARAGRSPPIEKNHLAAGITHGRQLGKRRMTGDHRARTARRFLQKIEARGRYETANRLRGTFRYALSLRHRDRPCRPRSRRRSSRRADRPAKVTHRAAITDPKAGRRAAARDRRL
jgi:hypothetical protein